MVINRNETVAPLFFYLYRQLTALRDDHQAAGFGIALYPEGVLVYTAYDRQNYAIDRSTFQLPPEAEARYRLILNSQLWWMDKMPRKLPVDGRASCASMLGFTPDQPAFECEDINTQVLAPFNSQRGMCARRLRVMLECMAEMLFDYGFELGVDHFSWDWKMVRSPDNFQAGAVQAGQPYMTGSYYQSGPYCDQQQFPQSGYAYYENQERVAQ